MSYKFGLLKSFNFIIPYLIPDTGLCSCWEQDFEAVSQLVYTLCSAPSSDNKTELKAKIKVSFSGFNFSFYKITSFVAHWL